MFRYLFNVYTICILIIGISVRISVLFETQENELNSDIKSAIRRAKTLDCRRELANFVHLHHGIDGAVKLSRTCGTDMTQQRNIRIGCIRKNTSGLVKLDEDVEDTTDCLNLCFSFRHSHGGFHSSLGCYCGDDGTDISSGSCTSNDEFDWHQVNNGLTQVTIESTGIDTRKEVRIAFLFLLSGKLRPQVERLFKLLYSDRHIYYFHVDSIDEHLIDFISELQKTHHNVVLAKERYRTVWGSPFLLQVIINSMEDLSSYKWDYMINLSESDFLLKPLDYIEKYLARSNLIYLKSHNIKGYNFIKKQGLNRQFYQCEDRVWRLGPRSLPSGIVYAGGSDWFVLPRDFCDYIIVGQYNNSSLVKPLLQLFNYTLLPAETFFHTVALNTEFCDRFANNNLRLTNWNLKLGCKCQHKDVVDWCGCSPQVYTDSDKTKLKLASLKPDLLFSRKFDGTVWPAIIDYVESLLSHHNSSGSVS